MVIGDEEREKHNFTHKNLDILGFQDHSVVLKIFKSTSISVVCSRWEEPFGRTSLESSSCGCAVIITNRGGLPETITNGVIIEKLSKTNVYNVTLVHDNRFLTWFVRDMEGYSNPDGQTMFNTYKQYFTPIL